MNRSKREAKKYDNNLEYKMINNRKLYNVRTCDLYLQADQKLYQAIYEKEGGRSDVR